MICSYNGPIIFRNFFISILVLIVLTIISLIFLNGEILYLMAAAFGFISVLLFCVLNHWMIRYSDYF